MATYTEIWGLFNDPALQQKVAVACIVAADTIRQEATDVANHANRLKWAKAAFSDPITTRDHMLKALLAANNTLTLVQLQGATDAAIQTAVANAVNVFADGNS